MSQSPDINERALDALQRELRKGLTDKLQRGYFGHVTFTVSISDGNITHLKVSTEKSVKLNAA